MLSKLRGLRRSDIDKESIPEADKALVRWAAKCSMLPWERLYANLVAVRHVEQHRVPGAIVECGVWRGGSAMIMGEALGRLGASRELHLFDTFSGMPDPTEVDRTIFGLRGADGLRESKRKKSFGSVWACSPLELTRTNLAKVNYDPTKFHLVEGRVQDTIPDRAPDQIALLRLDTDWYESTRHELEHLYPRLAPGGVLIIDDYGYWEGCRKAVDEYFSTHPGPILHRIDRSGRMGIKA